MMAPDFTAVRSILAANGLDAAAFVPGPNFARLMGRDFPLMERPLVLVLPKDADPIAIVPSLELASFSTLGFEGRVLGWKDQDGFEGAFKSLALARPELAHGKIGLEGQRMRVFEQMALASAYPEAIFFDAHAELSELRLIKTDLEVANLRAAIRISEQALEATLEEVRGAMTETEIKGILTRYLFEFGADGLAFDPIVAAGDNSAQPHAHSRPDYKIKSGDALLFDFGATYKGMNADITRTFFVGTVSGIDRDFYDTVLAANARGMEVVREGVTAHDVDDAVQRVLEQSPFAEHIRHKTGHGLGLDVHEAPQIMRGNKVPLEAGMVFTIEPGLYRPWECGVRIEDDVVVTEHGLECLTSFPRELRVLG